MKSGNQIRVWDPLIRGFHWLLVAAFTIAYFTDGEEQLSTHVWAGYVIIALLAIRFLWGFVGTPHARFSNFVRSPVAAIAFVRDSLRGRAKRYLGHNPAGGWMIVVLLIMLILIAVTGLLLYGADQHAGPLAGVMAGVGEETIETLEDLHEFFANLAVFLIMVHVAGVLLESVLHKENLLRAMVTGMKYAEDAEPVVVRSTGRVSTIIGGLLTVIVGLFLLGIMGGSEQARADIGTEAEIKDLNGLIPLEKIIDEAKARRDGQVIEAEVRTIDGTDVYEIEILDEEGKVWELYFNAKTGELISQGEEKNHASPDR